MTLVICNGARKTGTHLLKQCVVGMGFQSIPGVIKPGMWDPKDGSPVKKLPINSIEKDILSLAPDKLNHAIVGHIPYSDKFGPDKYITMIRNPRNIIVSFMRWAMRKKDTKINALLNDLYNDSDRLIQIIRNMNKIGLYEELLKYAKWLDDPDHLIVRFENLINKDTNNAQLVRIAKYLDIHSIDASDIAEKVIQGIDKERTGKTYSGELSNYEEYFTKKVEEEFIRVGGNKINEYFGY